MHGTRRLAIPGDRPAGRPAPTRPSTWWPSQVDTGSVVAGAEDPEELERLSWAAWWRSATEALFDAREHAYRAYRAAGRDVDAARMACWLGTDSVDFRGQAAVAAGWLRRARELLAGHEDTPEYGWLCIHEAEKLLWAGQTDAAIARAEEALGLAQQLRSADMRFLASATIGLARVLAGHPGDGADLLEEAGAAAVAGEFEEDWAAGWSCCYLYYGLEQIQDFGRASEWNHSIQAWAGDRFDAMNHLCRAHHAGVLMLEGRWAEAETGLQLAVAKLAQLRPPAAAEATARLGELRRRQGRLEDAMALFEAATGHPLACLGVGEICLGRGDATGARDRAEEYLRDDFVARTTTRAGGLSLLARAAAEAGDIAAAENALADLAEANSEVGSSFAMATHAWVSGLVAMSAGDVDRARIAAEDAIRLLQRVGAPWEEAQARRLLADVLHSLGRDQDSVRASAAADRIVAALLGDVRPTVLTARERQVLSLVADGLTNNDVAARLTISEHTVNRHMTNVLTKLGVSSRSAAVAAAMRDELL